MIKTIDRKDGPMKTAGIICEFNPLTAGHTRLIDAVRRAGAETVVCLMSGYFVQRGEPAIMPPHYRAEVAVRSGADAVFLLPFPYSASGAGYFAAAGVDILSRLGCDTIAFGSEAGDIDALKETAAVLEQLRAASNAHIAGDQCRPSNGIASDYFGDVKLDPNDILAVEYILAAKKRSQDLSFFTVKREGMGYNDSRASSCDDVLLSASAVRAELMNGRLPASLPDAMREAVVRAADAGHFPVAPDAAGDQILAFWRLCDQNAGYAECGGGLSAHLKKNALSSSSYSELLERAATKRYTNSRLRRALLLGTAGVKKEALDTPASYVRLLAANAEGRKLASAASGSGRICVVTRRSDIPRTEAAGLQYLIEERSASLYSLLLPHPSTAASLLALPPVII